MLAILFESLKTTTFLQVIVPTLVSLAIATQTLSQMRNSNWLWNLKLFQVTCQLNYTWNSVINQVEFWRLCNFQARNTNQVDPCMPNQCIKGNFDTLINDRSYWKIKKSNFQHKFWSPYIISIWTWLIFIDFFLSVRINLTAKETFMLWIMNIGLIKKFWLSSIFQKVCFQKFVGFDGFSKHQNFTQYSAV